VQQLTFTTLPTAGQTYSASLGGLSTNVTFAAATARTDLETALNNLLGGAGTVRVLGAGTAGFPAAANGAVYSVVFTQGGALGTTNLPQLIVRPSSGAIAVAPVSDGVGYSSVQSITLGGTGNEVQTITRTATGGTFTVTLGASTSAAIAFNAGANAVQAALEAMPSIGVGNVRVTGAGSCPVAVRLAPSKARWRTPTWQTRSR